MSGLVEHLRSCGFDLSEDIDSGVEVRCSRCVAYVINSMACHEHGCPNVPRRRISFDDIVDEFEAARGE